MQVKRIKKEIMSEVFVSIDGKEFDDKYDCEVHEGQYVIDSCKDMFEIKQVLSYDGNKRRMMFTYNEIAAKEHPDLFRKLLLLFVNASIGDDCKLVGILKVPNMYIISRFLDSYKFKHQKKYVIERERMLCSSEPGSISLNVIDADGYLEDIQKRIEWLNSVFGYRYIISGNIPKTSKI